MKIRTVGLLAAGAMTLTSLTVWSVTPPGGFAHRATEEAAAVALAEVGESALVDSALPAADWKFESGTTLTVEGRLGHTSLQSSQDNDTFLLLKVRAQADAIAQTSAPVNLAIVIDRSGSMQGKRMSNALEAARGMVRRLRPGDAVSVVTYNTQAQTLVASTLIDDLGREQVLAQLDNIAPVGDTCISCGIDRGMEVLRQRRGMVDRMLLLSDGEATAGVRDVAGFQELGARAREMGCAISSIGVDVSYNERVMTAVAQHSNGRHYFVESPSGLASIFDQELESLVRTVANATEARIELAPGVEVREVFDRAFRREGNAIVIPLGAFAAGNEKSVLVKVRVPRGAEGARDVADVRLVFDDLVAAGPGQCQGKLVTRLTSDPAEVSPLDALVDARVRRTETAATLLQANTLFAQGRVASAQKVLHDKRGELEKHKSVLEQRAPKTRARELDADLEGQLAALDAANTGFATPPPPSAGGGLAAAPAAAPQESRPGKAQVRRNAASALELAH